MRFRPIATIKKVIGLGGGLIAFFELVTEFLILGWATLKACFTRPFYVSLTIEQFNLLIVKSIPLVLITVASTGAVMALQFGQGMSRFGGKLYVPTVVTMAIIRALSPILTSLMIAGRVGAGIAAELGSMSVTQQVDAIRALGTDPIRKLVVPRVIVLTLGLPMLTLLSDLAGILGGLVSAFTSLGISPSLYVQKSYDAIKMHDLIFSTTKTGLFGCAIALIASFNGLRTRGGTAGIGIATTKTVMAASLLIMISDVFLTKLAWILR